jgi:hypothetical protein
VTTSISSGISITPITTRCGTDTLRVRSIGRIRRSIGTCEMACIRSIGRVARIQNGVISNRRVVSQGCAWARGAHPT